MTRLPRRSRAGAASRLALVAALALLFAPIPRAHEPQKGSQKEYAKGTALFGVVGFYNPRLLYLKYQPLVDYLEDTTGRDWELKIYTTYDDTVDDLCAEHLSAAYLGPLTYVRAHAQCGAVPIVRLNTGNSPTIRSYVMVRNDSPIKTLEELRGKRFGFGSPLSTTSHLAPRAMLEDLGLHPRRDYECLYFEHHEKAARSVLLGHVDACGVRDTVGERFASRGLRILARSEPIENFPIVVPVALVDTIGAELLEALVKKPQEDPDLARRMEKWDEEIADGFRAVREEDYSAIRTLALRILGDGALTMSAEETRCGP